MLTVWLAEKLTVELKIMLTVTLAEKLTVELAVKLTVRFNRLTVTEANNEPSLLSDCEANSTSEVNTYVIIYNPKSF